VNDVWTVPGEEHLLAQWQKEDRLNADHHDPMKYYHFLQIEDFLQAILEDREPMVSGEEARKAVELFTAVYRAQRDRKPVSFPLQPETGGDLDGRLSLPLFSQNDGRKP
jgi:predicted dehydrogenase